MENLPLLCLKKVFDYLPNLNEQIRCSLTCKKWRTTFQLFKPSTLCLYADNYLPFHKRFSYTNERFTNSNSFSVSFFEEFLASEITRSYFGHIKKLAFYRYSDVNVCDHYGFLPKFEFARQLNHFRELEYLEMENDRKFVYYLKDRIMDLPKLKVLSLDTPFTSKETFKHYLKAGFDRFPIFLNTPSLRTFRGRFCDFKFLFPNQLRHLELVYIQCLPIKFEQKFPNLECLILNKFNSYSKDSDTKIVSDETLSSLPRLKILIWKMNGSPERSPYSSALIQQVAELNLNDLQILLFCKCALDFLDWRQYTKFFGQIDHLSDSVSVESLSDLMTCEIPSHYFGGYLQISHLNIKSIKEYSIDQSLLLKLLKSSRYIDKLEISFVSPLEQRFFDLLPDCVSGQYLTFEDLSYSYYRTYDRDDEPGLCRICDFKFLKSLAFKSISFTVRTKRFLENCSHDPVFSLLKNETCLSIALQLVGDHLSYEKRKSHCSLFRDFDCPKCLQSITNENAWSFDIEHINEHLVTENVHKNAEKWSSYPFRETPFDPEI